jgi:hypothetical protein
MHGATNATVVLSLVTYCLPACSKKTKSEPRSWRGLINIAESTFRRRARV